MNPGQEKFLSFILERVREEEKENAEELLQGNFKKQEESSFSMEDMVYTQKKLMEMLKSEFIDEVKEAMNHFASQMKH